eukprot:scaffold172869_cov27-Tisochrysis_lutea.AAC.1
MEGTEIKRALRQTKGGRERKQRRRREVGPSVRPISLSRLAATMMGDEIRGAQERGRVAGG